MGQALYRKYRSTSLADIVGQSHITDVLERALKQGKIAHAYLLTGPRGIGKTSIARILAHEITKLPYDGSEYLDIIEIDAASNNGVEDIRELRDKARITPVQSDKKVYIIDEVHMLSKPAFNALLKTLEEPPEHIVFILATTDVEKLPSTIISRTQRFNLRRITEADATQHLTKIAQTESISIEPAAVELLAKYGDGSFRDAINLLDQLSSLQTDKDITTDDIRAHLGIAEDDSIDAVLQAYSEHNLASLVSLVNNLESSGISINLFARQLLQASLQRVTKQPELLNLLDDLVAVESSLRPEITLLVALTKNIAATAPPTTKVTPAVNPDPPQATAKSNDKPKQPESKLAKAQPEPKPEANNKSTKASESKTTDSPKKTKPAAKKSTKPAGPNQDYPWQEVIDQIKPQSIGLANLLQKSSPHYDGSTLTIYSGNKLYASKLDTSKYRALFMDKSSSLGQTVDELIVSADKPPISDPGLASVADLMGGGEMVDIT